MHLQYGMSSLTPPVPVEVEELRNSLRALRIDQARVEEHLGLGGPRMPAAGAGCVAAVL
jgi:hypothetical protein